MALILNGTTGASMVQDGTITSAKIVDGSIGFVDMIGTQWENIKTINGYTKLPNGIIMQWGTVSIVSSGSVTVTLPIPFPSAGVFVDLSSNVYYAVAEANNAANFISNSQIILYSGHHETVNYRWFAIGY